MPKRNSPEPRSLTCVDLFCGMGGFRLALEKNEFQCILSCEIDKQARETYSRNFEEGKGHVMVNDIRDIGPNCVHHLDTISGGREIDLFVGGFPCQPFSSAGVARRNALGQLSGFEMPEKGDLVFEVVRLFKEYKPRSFLLENVKGLKRNNQLNIILECLEKQCGYHVTWKMINGADWLPQNRERIFIVGFRKEEDLKAFKFPDPPSSRPMLKELLKEKLTEEEEQKFTMTQGMFDCLERHRETQRARTGGKNGFGYSVIDPWQEGQDSIRTRTMTTNYPSTGFAYLNQGPNKRPRLFMPREIARLFGFPDSFQLPEKKTVAHKQLGNSVCVPLVTDIIRNIKIALQAEKFLQKLVRVTS